MNPKKINSANSAYSNFAAKMVISMHKEFKDFYDVIRENLDSYRGEYERFIDYGPDLFKLLSDMLNEENLRPELRLKICASLGYFVTPYDVIPEHIYGPHGYIDDIFLCCYVLKILEKEVGYESLDYIWDGEEELKDVIKVCYDSSKQILDNQVDEILAYVGLNKKKNSIFHI